MTPAAQRLKEVLAKPGLLVVPASWDALSAKLVGEAGYPMQFMSGFAVALNRLGFPDTGMISFAEMVDALRNITAASDVPVLADGDDGYGNALNVQRTVSEYARAGAAAVLIEDKINPKPCGMAGEKPVIERPEAIMKIKAAIEAGRKAGILILARTDSRPTRGFEEALARIKAFAELGADMVFLDSPASAEEMRAYCAAVDKPCMANIMQGDKLAIPRAELARMGIKIATHPFYAMNAAIAAARAALQALKHDDLAGMPPAITSAELRTLAGYPEYRAREARFAPKAE